MAERDERVAANEVTFRQANHVIRERAAELRVEDTIPFICECHKETCTEIVTLTPDQYTAVRQSPTCFFVIPGHASPTEAVVDRRDGYDVVEKTTGAARRIAEASAPPE